ncbi:class I SAM-dependent methyltransferase [Candidatus Peregrinibacteria bacterium]|nr:class I SAM-dependent methyltransferase [Candidatus Peregrinibacteria bacterium]
MESAEQYQSPRYQRTAEIESRVSHGMDIEERYEKEVDFILRATQINFQKNDRILDLACGAGGHSRCLAQKTGVEIDARDLSEALIQKAKDKTVEEVSESVRDRIHFAVGDMGNIEGSITQEKTYKMITILGSSFMYLGTKENHQKALRDYFGRLERGGKLCLQFREKRGETNQAVQKEWQKRLGVTVYSQKATGKKGQFGEFAEADEDVHVLKDTTNGDGFYFYSVPMENTKDLMYKTARPEEKLREGWYDRDGVRQSGFGRAYFDTSGTEEDLGRTYIKDYMSVNGYNKALKRMLEEAGFINVRLESEPLSEDGSVLQFAVIAEKP